MAARRGSRLLLAGVAMTSMSTTAAAQDRAATTPAETAAGDQEESSSANDIVVTAQRREERLQDVPSAVTALTDSELVSSGIRSTRDLSLLAPGLAFVQSSFAPQPSIRGIGTRGSNPGDEQTVPLYIDGVYQPFTVGGIFELTDVERIEVLRGPQGILLGRNATGGAINIITRTPRPDLGGGFNVSYGSFNQIDAQAFASGGHGPIAGSLSAAYRNDDGYIDDLTRGGRTAAVNSFIGRAKLRWELGVNTTATLSAAYSERSDSTGSAVQPLNGNTAAKLTSATVLVPVGRFQSATSALFEPVAQSRQYTASLTLLHRFGAFDLTSITGGNRSRVRQNSDSDGTQVVRAFLQYNQYDHGLVQELYATSAISGPFAWTAGVFYFRDEAGQNPFNNTRVVTSNRIDTEAYAGYVQGSYDLTETLKATVGVRYSHDHKRARAVNAAGVQALDVAANFSSTDPSVVVEYKPSASVLAYARYGSAYKSGLFNASSFSTVPVDPERVKSGEVGIKSDPFRWLRLNLAGYYTAYDNIQVSARDPAGQVRLQNAAAGEIYGLEADFQIRPVERLVISGGLSALRSEYSNFPTAQVATPRPAFQSPAVANMCPAGLFACGNINVIRDLSGKPLTKVPATTFSVAGAYTVPTSSGAFALNANLFHSSGFSWDVADRIRQRPYTLVNGQVSFRPTDGPVTIALWAENLFDERYDQTQFSSVNGDFVVYASPRRVGVRLTANFD